MFNQNLEMMKTMEKAYYSPSDTMEYFDGESFYNSEGDQLRDPSEYDENTAIIVKTIVRSVMNDIEERYQKAEKRLQRYVAESYLIDCGDHYKVNYIPFSTYRKKIENNLINGVLPKELAVDALY